MGPGDAPDQRLKRTQAPSSPTSDSWQWAQESSIHTEERLNTLSSVTISFRQPSPESPGLRLLEAQEKFRRKFTQSL